jgi:hypothetical protein
MVKSGVLFEVRTEFLNNIYIVAAVGMAAGLVGVGPCSVSLRV